MAFINVFIESPCNISVKDNSLYLKNEEKSITYPIEDINCVLIECLTNNITAYTLNNLAESGVTLIICNEKHLPFSVFMPINGYYKKTSVLQKQLSLSKPRQKSLWQAIIKQKILGQAECLKRNGKNGHEGLIKIAKNVSSGDSDNSEARAAAIYFKNLFGNDFSRENDSAENGFLNYTYAIVRALICRHLSARGFECSIGIFHNNQLNCFNLADDIIEPFRPIIDNFVLNICKGENALTPKIKRELFAVVNLNVLSGGEKHSLSNAVERIVESLLSYYNGENDNLIMPSICDITMHEYE